MGFVSDVTYWIERGIAGKTSEAVRVGTQINYRPSFSINPNTGTPTREPGIPLTSS